MKKVDIKIQVNDDWYELTVDPGERLVDVLRDQLGLTGTKRGLRGRGVRRLHNKS